MELNSASNVMSNGDISMSIPQPNDDDSIPQPDVDDDSMFDDNEDQVLEDRRCEEFLSKTCGCSKVNGKPCSSLFTVQHYTDLRAQASLLTHEQLDLVIMGSIMSATNVTDDNIHGHHRPAMRQKTCIGYMHNGQKLCRKTYNFLHGVGEHRVPAIKNSYINDGLTPAIMKATNRSDREKDKVLPVNYTFLHWFANGSYGDSSNNSTVSIRHPPFTLIVCLVKGCVFNCNHIFVNPIYFENNCFVGCSEI